MNNFIDKTIGYFSPSKAAKRERDRMRLSAMRGFTGASKTKKSLSTWKTFRSDPGDILSFDSGSLIDRSYDLDRNNPMASGAISTLSENIVGTGLKVQSQIDYKYLGMSEQGARDWQSEAERIFKLWACDKSADSKKEQNFYQMQNTAFISTLLTGDAFAQRQYIRNNEFLGTSWRLVDSQRVSNPNYIADSRSLMNGIERDSSGAPRWYHVSNTHPYDNKQVVEWRKYSPDGVDGYTKNLIHAFRKRAITENRGRPVLAPVMEAFKQLGRYMDAELSAAVVSSLFTVFVKSVDGGTEIESYEGDSPASSPSNTDYSMGSGAVVGLGENEDVSFADPARPNSGFDPFVLAVLRQIGVAIGLPYEMIIKHFTASYSASRAALNEAQRSFKERRVWFASSFCQPIYESVIIESIAKGYLMAPGFFDDYQTRKSYLNTMWAGDAWGSLDPVKDVSAAEKRLTLGLTTRTQETLEMTGGDYEKNSVQRQKEFEIEKGMRNESDRDDQV